jgi:acetyl esterase/lipase
MAELTRREFVYGGMCVGIGLRMAPSMLQSSGVEKTLAATATANPYALVDPELVPPLKMMPTVAINSGNLADARKVMPTPPLPSPATQPVKRRILGPPGAPDLQVVIVDPAQSTLSAKRRPAFVYVHGGGYIAGSAEQEVPFLQTIAERCKCLVVSPDYRLAPETHFPGSFEDNYAALKWLYNNAHELGVDRNRIAIGGASAGVAPDATVSKRFTESWSFALSKAYADSAGI